jgi:hypothetical protein
MPAVIFFACLDLEQKYSFMDGHRLEFIYYLRKRAGSYIAKTLLSAYISESGMDHLL